MEKQRGMAFGFRKTATAFKKKNRIDRTANAGYFEKKNIQLSGSAAYPDGLSRLIRKN